MNELDTKIDETVSTQGDYQSGVSTTSKKMVDPVTGSTVSAKSTRMWAGKSAFSELIWLIVGVISLFLAGDFLFHAMGANAVGFAAFVFSVGGFFAAPFTGIFNVSTTPNGSNLYIWADILAIVVYAIIGLVVVKAATIMSNNEK